MVVIGRNGAPENEPHESVDVRNEQAVAEFFETQPAFDVKTWDKIVKKMIMVYGAPLSDSSQIKSIVKYLTEFKKN